MPSYYTNTEISSLDPHNKLVAWRHLTNAVGQACFCPFFSSSFEGIPLTQQHEILSRNTRYSMLSYGEN